MLDNDTRQELATKLNEMVDIPLIGEDAEQDMAEKLIDVCLGPVEENEPATEEMAEMARSTSRRVMENMVTSKLVKAVNAAIDVPFINEEQEEKAITLVVCYVMTQKFDQAAELAEEIDRQEAITEKGSDLCSNCAIM